MEDAEQLNSFLVDVFGRINKIEERAMAGGLGSAVSITEIHIIEKIGDREPVRMSEVARSIGVTLATLTVACDKLVAKGLVRRVRSQEDRRVVNIMLTDKGRAAYEYHKDFHERMIASLVDTLSPEQTALLAQSLEKLQDFFRHESVVQGAAADPAVPRYRTGTHHRAVRSRVFLFLCGCDDGVFFCRLDRRVSLS